MSDFKCQGLDPAFFDWEEYAEDALKVCATCPKQQECLDIVDPAASFYDGTVGGALWRNGYMVPMPDWEPSYALNRYMEKAVRVKPGQPLDVTNAVLLAEGVLHWKAVGVLDRAEAGRIMLRRGASTSEVQERTRLNGATIRKMRQAIRKRWTDGQ